MSVGCFLHVFISQWRMHSGDKKEDDVKDRSSNKVIQNLGKRGQMQRGSDAGTKASGIRISRGGTKVMTVPHCK